ncbi:V-type proton ATPase subunit S1-like [Bradysia coprophila]|uniref:V-type proton ATPase subunit S1-like n=1 Tax=Bradysia coprophila TaxID=38358 RepID=UPI00187DCFF9|nr:V-type proton ATPase subunit S1-like [Bradysia coprophila]
MTKITVECFIVFLCGLVTADNVPVLIWGSNIKYEPTIALQHLHSSDFYDKISNATTPDTIIVVVGEDELSTEDITQCKTETGSCFPEIQQIENKQYFASVEDPMQILEHKAGPNSTEVEFLADGSLNKSLDTLHGYVFVNFENNDKIKTRSTLFTHHDRLITNLYKELSSKDRNVLVIYTGRGSRTSCFYAKKNGTISGRYCRNPHFLLYYSYFNVSDGLRNVTETVVFDVVTAKYTNATRSNSSSTDVSVNVLMIATEKRNCFQFKIVAKNNYWWIDEANWNNQSLILSRQTSIASNFSFHCTNYLIEFPMNKTMQITWADLQLQPNFNSSAIEPLLKFNDVQDCVFFITPGILSGLFVVCLLLLILFISISCILDININDRFDKSQHVLTFTVSE